VTRRYAFALGLIATASWAFLGCADDDSATGGTGSSESGAGAGGTGAAGNGAGGDGGDTCPEPPCDPADLAFVHVPITIDDPIVNGMSLMVPVDGVSYAFDGQGTFATAFGRDFDDPTETFLWLVDEDAGTHVKQALSGQVFSQIENLCVDEDWCQLIGRDGEDWVIAGPAATQMMRIDASYSSTLSPVSGSQPPATFINHSHRFAGSELFLFGATGPSGFADTVHVLDLQTGSWSAAVTGLQQTDDNCIAYDESSGMLYSVAGRTTLDGGDTTETLSTLTAIDIAGGTSSSSELPPEIGARSQMSCAFDQARGLLYAFGGARVLDRFNDALNELHNDLWAYDVDADTWTLLVEDTMGGTLDDPDEFGDQRFIGDPSGPNFGRNRGVMRIDAEADRLTIIGAVPVFTHEQLYVLSLEGIEQHL
jgi:hypothetical protein